MIDGTSIRYDRAALLWHMPDPPLADILGFRIYREATEGRGIDRTAPLIDIPVSQVGGVGYQWESGRLPDGLHRFGVAAYGPDGRESHLTECSVRIPCGPEPVPDPRVTASAVQHVD